MTPEEMRELGKKRLEHGNNALDPVYKVHMWAEGVHWEALAELCERLDRIYPPEADLADPKYFAPVCVICGHRLVGNKAYRDRHGNYLCGPHYAKLEGKP